MKTRKLTILLQKTFLILGSLGFLVLFQNCTPVHDQGTASNNSENFSEQDLAAVSILQKYCLECHGAGQSLGNVSDIDNIDHLLSSELLIPGELNSPIFQEIILGSMPSLRKGLEPDEIDTLRKWIIGFGIDDPNTPPTEENPEVPIEYPDPPVCTLVASSTTYTTGQAQGITLTLTIQGVANHIDINGATIDLQDYEETVVTPETSRHYTATVTNEGGSAVCRTNLITVN